MQIVAFTCAEFAQSGCTTVPQLRHFQRAHLVRLMLYVQRVEQLGSANQPILAPLAFLLCGLLQAVRAVSPRNPMPDNPRSPTEHSEAHASPATAVPTEHPDRK